MKKRILAIILMSILTLSGISTAEVSVFADESADYLQIDGSGMQETESNEISDETDAFQAEEPMAQPVQTAECLVQFDLCGYGIEIALFVMPGERVQRPENPTAEGLLFAGWFREPEYITEWNFEFDVVTEDTMLFAKWLPAVESAEESELQVDPPQNLLVPESTEEALSAPEGEIEKEADMQTDFHHEESQESEGTDQEQIKEETNSENTAEDDPEGVTEITEGVVKASEEVGKDSEEVVEALEEEETLITSKLGAGGSAEFGAGDYAWGYSLMNLTETKKKAEQAKDQLNEKEVVVAIIDTGINGAIPSDRISPLSGSFDTVGTYTARDYFDYDGNHGTQIAKVIADNTPDNVKLLILKAMDYDKNGHPKGGRDQVANAIRYAAVNCGADVINLSLYMVNPEFKPELWEDPAEYYEYIATLDNVINEAGKTAIVVSAGNYGSDIDASGVYPAQRRDVITVSALSNASSRDEKGNVTLVSSSETNFGDAVDFCAPGPDTSIAASFITAAYALVKLSDPSMSKDEIIETLVSYSKGITGKSAYYGYGIPVLEMGYDIASDVPDHPDIESVSSDGTAITLTWKALDHVLYHVYRKVNSEPFILIETVTGGSYIDREIDCTADNLYEYYIESATPGAYAVSDMSVSRRCYGRIHASSIRTKVEGGRFTGYKYLIPIGESLQIQAEVEPLNAYDRTVIWSNSDDKTVSVDSTGKVTGLQKGEASITCSSTDEGAEVTITVAVYDDTCGENLYWNVENTDDGCTLYISGIGDMYDFFGTTVPWYDLRKEITKIVIDDTVTSIGDYAFEYCDNLKEVQGMEGIISIGKNAFQNCSALKTLPLSDKVTRIQSGFFQVRFDSFFVPAKIEDLSFLRSVSTKAFTVSSENTRYCIVDGVLFDNSKTQLLRYPTLKEEEEYTIPEGVQVVEYSAFYFAEKVKNINIPDSVRRIKSDAFYQADNLQNVSFDEDCELIELGQDAFAYCYSLGSFVCPHGIKDIPASCFTGCNRLTVMILPEGVETVWAGTFGALPNSIQELHLPASCTAFLWRDQLPHWEDNFPSLTDIYYSGFTKEFHEIVLRHAVDSNLTQNILDNTAIKNAALHISKTGTAGPLAWKAEGLSGDLTLTISGNGRMPDYLPDTMPWHDGKDEITKIVIEDGVESVGKYAFYNFDNVKEVVIPKTVKEYGSMAFLNIPGLESFTYYRPADDPREELKAAVQYLAGPSGSGDGYRPGVKVLLYGEAKKEIEINSTDYRVIYEKKTGAGYREVPAMKYAGTYRIRVEFLNGYASYESLCIPFDVCSRSLIAATFHKLENMVLSPETGTYTGGKQMPEINVTSGHFSSENGDLKENVDFRLEYAPSSDWINVGSYTVTAYGCGVYQEKPEISRTYTITEKKEEPKPAETDENKTGNAAEASDSEPDDPTGSDGKGSEKPVEAADAGAESLTGTADAGAGDPAGAADGGAENPAGAADGGAENPAGATDGGAENPAGAADGGAENPAGAADEGAENPAGAADASDNTVRSTGSGSENASGSANNKTESASDSESSKSNINAGNKAGERNNYIIQYVSRGGTQSQDPEESEEGQEAETEESKNNRNKGKAKRNPVPAADHDGIMNTASSTNATDAVTADNVSAIKGSNGESQRQGRKRWIPILAAAGGLAAGWIVIVMKKRKKEEEE